MFANTDGYALNFRLKFAKTKLCKFKSKFAGDTGSISL